MSKPAIVPVAQNETNQCTVTPQWFVDGSEYHPLLGSFRLLINGEEAFREVYLAIQAAQKSVSIICWGFQPSMYFIRDGASLRIGELLEKLAIEKNIKIRILSWAGRLDDAGVSTTSFIGEPNAPGAQLRSRPATSTDAQHQYDTLWYHRYDPRLAAEREAIRRHGVKGYDPLTSNLLFADREFSAHDRKQLATQEYADKGLSWGTKALLSGAPSHHQKTVLVDVEDPHACTGFIMGHNMLDGYWDTDAHSAQRSMILYGHPEREPQRRANGKVPLHDFSARITGPIVGDVFANFAVAWEKQTGEALEKPDFTHYPINPLASDWEKQLASRREAQQASAPQPPPIATRDPVIMAQILRTQPQYGKEDIKACYLQAVNNATQYIHIENQYFRWPVLAEKIKACAAGQTCAGRQPETHGPLYLFVITNSTDDGVGKGTVNTYRMLESLGRADAIPAVAKKERADDVSAALAHTRYEMARTQRTQQDIRRASPFWPPGPRSTAGERYAALQKKIDTLKAQEKALLARKKQLDDKDTPVEPEDVPGLKCLVGTLVAPDTRDGQPWVEVYIHAKLMLVNDAFMTLGSANINTRSMQVDSELNIAHHRPEITQPTRQKLWKQHTGNKSGMETMDAKGMKLAYTAWKDLMERNQKIRDKLAPEAPLAPFLRTSPKRSNKD